MRQTKLVNIRLECEIPQYIYRFYSRGSKEYVAALEQWVTDFHEFIRDHRSQDPVFLSIERDYEYVCSYCGNVWDEDSDGFPCCCQAAYDEHEEVNKCTMQQH